MAAQPLGVAAFIAVWVVRISAVFVVLIDEEGE